MYTRYTCIYTKNTPNAPLNTPSTPHIHPIYTLNALNTPSLHGKTLLVSMGHALSFKAARTFVRTLKLGSQKEWKEYSKSGERPSNIPGAPYVTYVEKILVNPSY